MAKNLPYFKFIASEWLTGDIVYEDFDIQGMFISLCAMYWNKGGELHIEDAIKKLRTDKILQLQNRFFFIENDTKISIKFLDEQLEMFKHISAVNSANAKKGATAKRPLSENSATAKRKNSDRSQYRDREDKEKKKSKKEKSSALHFFEDSEFFEPTKFKQALPDWPPQQLRHYYDALLAYSNKGNKYRNWVTTAKNWANKDAEKKEGFFTPKKVSQGALGTNDCYN